MGIELIAESENFVELFVPSNYRPDLKGVNAHQFLWSHGLRVLQVCGHRKIISETFFKIVTVKGQLLMCEKLPTFVGLPE